MARVRFLVPLALFLIVAGYFALALRPGHDPQTLPSAMIDKPAPTFDLAAYQSNQRLSSTALSGRVVLVNFFASWCVPCRAEQPMLSRMASQDKILLYGIDYKDKPADLDAYLGELGDPYKTIGLDPDGRLALDFGVYGVPETYVIDKTGHIRFRQVGPITQETLETTILPLVKKLSAS